MGYSTEVIIRARERLAQERSQRQSRNFYRQQEIYAQLPRVRQIDSLLQKTMALAARAAMLPDGQQAMEVARAENRQLQQERRELISAHFGPEYQEEELGCKLCSDEGYVGTRMCSCLEALCVQEQQREIALLSCDQGDFSQFRLDYYPDRTDPGTGYNPRRYMATTLSLCKDYAERFGAGSGNLLFSGNTGLGKTMLSACIARAITQKGFSVAYESAAHLFSALEQARFCEDPEQRREAAEKCAKYTRCDLMIIDDLGTEMAGQFVTAALYSLINDRLLAGKATIISTNLTNQEMEKRYSPQILSRLRGHYTRVPFLGEDIRILKNRGL